MILTPTYSAKSIIYLLRFWVDGVLNVALANDSQVPDNLDGGASQHVVLVIVQRLTRSHDYRLPGVNSERVNVLHVTDLGYKKIKLPCC